MRSNKKVTPTPPTPIRGGTTEAGAAGYYRSVAIRLYSNRNGVRQGELIEWMAGPEALNCPMSDILRDYALEAIKAKHPKWYARFAIEPSA